MANLWRLTQEAIEVQETGVTFAGGNRVRLTQEAIEVQETGVTFAGGNRVRLTQEAIEVQESVTFAGGNRVRLTQIAVEVQITQPLEPFPPGDFLIPEPWSPAFLDNPMDSQANLYASFFGIHRQVLSLGARRRWVNTLRR